MIFVGDGYDKQGIEQYAREQSLFDDCIFTGAIYDRELLRVYYSLADFFLFPSTFDTNGIAVTEAAACSCPSLLIEGSCAAERVTHMENGILIQEDAQELADAVEYACNNLPRIREIGEAAAESIYLSWDDAVARAYLRYETILGNYVPRKDFQSTKLAFIEDMQQLKDDLGLKKKRLINFYRAKQEMIVKELLEQLGK
jgi:glycosyltransferase involved in cell wall biosynthesis